MSVASAGEGAGGTRRSTLCDEEERALASLRDIVARIRASGAVVAVASMEEEIRAAGGTKVHSSEADGVDTFLLGGARFTLRPVSALPGRVEVNFIPIAQ